MGRPKKIKTEIVSSGETESLAIPAAPPPVLGVEVAAIEHQMQRLDPVANQAQLDRYNQYLVASKQRAKDLDAELKGMTSHLNEALTRIRGWFRPAVKAHEQFQNEVKRRIADYMLAQEAAQIRQLEAAKVSFEAGNEAAADAMVEIINSRPTLAAGTSAKTVWKCEITDPAAVPREYCAPDEALIRAAVKAGARGIPGVRIYEDKQFVVHTAGRS